MKSTHVQHHLNGTPMKELCQEKEIYMPGCLRKVHACQCHASPDE